MGLRIHDSRLRPFIVPRKHRVGERTAKDVLEHPVVDRQHVVPPFSFEDVEGDYVKAQQHPQGSV
jgi:hypothetical protein